MKRVIKHLVAIAALALPLSLTAQVKSYFGSTPALKVSGKEIVDPNGRPVSLHGVMDTPSPYFNAYRWTNGQWVDLGRNGDQYVNACKNYFDKVFSAITDQRQGAYCNLFRLHLDPCWTNDPNKTATAGGGEADISRFSADRLRKYLNSLYIPIAENAVKHGLYVIIRPPGVFPQDVTVGDAYNQYLLTVWDIVSQNATLKQYSGQISLELGNEPVRMNGSLVDYFQPIVNKIRQNGFNGILWLPGTSYQAQYTDYTKKTLYDPKNNYGFAVHNYPGWYGGWDANQSQASFIQTFENQVPVVKTHPIVITEVDWSPMKQGAGHWNEMHTQYTEGNYGTWGTGTTYNAPTNIAYPNTQNKNWGIRFKTLVDKHTNISWTLQGTTTYVDMDKYLATGVVQPAFLDQMKAAGYPDAYQACSGACFGWYKEYASGDRVPMEYVGSNNNNNNNNSNTNTNTANEIGFGSAHYEASNGRYYFRGPNNSWFEFDNLMGKKVAECDELTIVCGNGSTTGYRLDLRMKDANGNVITDGTDASQHYYLGTDAAGTRSESPVLSKTYKLRELLSYYINKYPNCTFDKIRLNTAVPYGKSDSEYQNNYWFTLTSITVKAYVAPTPTEPEIGFGSAHYDSATKRYYFRGPNNSWFEFDDLMGKKVMDCAEMTIKCGSGSTTGYRLDLRMKDANGNIITDGTDASQHYFIGTEDAGTRSEAPVLSKTYALQDLLEYYINKYPNCTFDKIRLNTTVPYGKSDSEYQNNYWFTLSGISINQTHATASVGASNSITSLKFAEYNMPGNGTKVSEFASNAYDHNISSNASTLSGGATIYGTASVNYDDYVDVSDYKTLTLKGSSTDNQSVRILLNRQRTSNGNGDWTEVVVGSNATIDLSQYGYAHIHAIKVNWGKSAKITSAVLTDANGNKKNLTAMPFCKWNVEIAGVKNSNISGNHFNLNNSAASGAEIVGVELRGMVQYNQYIDLSGYTRMVIKGQGGTLRVLMNRTANSQWVEIKPSLENGEATIDLTPYEYVHLNSVKVDWGSTVTVNSIRLYNDNSEIADYYLKGAGYAESSFLNAMWDSKARIIDATGMTNKVNKACMSANPNCLFIQKSSNALAGTQNLVTKNGSSYSASNIALEDGNPFYAPFNISASYVSYTRNLTSEWATVTLPFATTAGNGADMYTISSVSNDRISLARIQTGTFIAANTPIIYRKQGAGTVKLEGNNIVKTVGGYNVQAVSNVGDWYLCQTMIEGVVDLNSDPVLKNYDVYELRNGQFTLLTGKQTTKVFGAYILHKKNGSARSSYGISISSNAVAPEATGIEEITNEAVEVARYNSAGQLIPAPAKGLNIIRMSDGTVRKVMVK